MIEVVHKKRENRSAKSMIITKHSPNFFFSVPIKWYAKRVVCRESNFCLQFTNPLGVWSITGVKPNKLIAVDLEKKKDTIAKDYKNGRPVQQRKLGFHNL
jgi:hypothetical protein